MRGGRIIVEDCPYKLLQKYDYCRLEQVVLHICKLDKDHMYNDLTVQNDLQTRNGRNGDKRSDLKSFSRLKLCQRKIEQDFDIKPKDSLRSLHESLHENEHSDIYNFFRTTLAFVKVIFLIFLRYPAYVQTITSNSVSCSEYNCINAYILYV